MLRKHNRMVDHMLLYLLRVIWTASWDNFIAHKIVNIPCNPTKSAFYPELLFVGCIWGLKIPDRFQK